MKKKRVYLYVVSIVQIDTVGIWFRTGSVRAKEISKLKCAIAFMERINRASSYNVGHVAHTISKCRYYFAQETRNAEPASARILRNHVIHVTHRFADTLNGTYPGNLACRERTNSRGKTRRAGSLNKKRQGLLRVVSLKINVKSHWAWMRDH